MSLNINAADRAALIEATKTVLAANGYEIGDPIAERQDEFSARRDGHTSSVLVRVFPHFSGAVPFETLLRCRKRAIPCTPILIVTHDPIPPVSKLALQAFDITAIDRFDLEAVTRFSSDPADFSHAAAAAG